jgi:methionine-rich copper-binding protein CopC
VVLQKEGGGGDNVCVRWRLPSGAIEEPIPGSRVALYMDDLPPTISYTFPADGAVGVDTSASVEIHFSEIMEPDNMLTAFQLFDSGASPVAGTSYFAGRVLSFTPEPGLGPFEMYVGSLDPAGLLDRAGNPLPAGVIFSFTTSDNDMPPTVDHTSPADGDVGVAVSAAVEIHFSEAMRDQNMLTAFLLFDSDNVLVAGTSSFSDPVLTYTPAADLKLGETYMGVLTANDLLDLAGTPLQTGMSFSFTTFDPDADTGEGNGCLPAASGIGVGTILCVAAAALSWRPSRA